MCELVIMGEAVRKQRNNFLVDIFSFSNPPRQQIDLNGVWSFRRDLENIGLRERWHAGKEVFRQRVSIPGVPQAQGIGRRNKRQKNFFLEPFWVRRTFEMSKLVPGQRAWLRIGGILPAAEIYINGSWIGYTKSSRTAQRIDVTSSVKPGRQNMIAIKVCDFPPVRMDGIWEYVEALQTWTGVYGPVGIEITSDISIIDAYIRPILRTGTVHLSLDLSSAASGQLYANVDVSDGKRMLGRSEIRVPKGRQHAEARVRLKKFMPWSPRNPKLYTLRVSVTDAGQTIDCVKFRFGMREIRTTASRFLLNGKPLFLRAFGDDQLYLDTLCPPSDKSWYVERLQRARAFGMNCVKGCCDVLPREYVEAADEVGIIVIQEWPFGLGALRENRYRIGKRFRSYYLQETEGLVKQSRNHASVLAYSMSSELRFREQTRESFKFFSSELVRKTRQLAPHALVIDCTGYGVDDQEFTEKGRRDTDFYATVINSQHTWGKEILDEVPVKNDGRHPAMLHEFSWWGCYPNPGDRKRYERTQFSPSWFDTLERTAEKNGQEHLLPLYRKNSLWLQELCRKDGIEYARRNPKVEGFILWLLIDLLQYSEGLFDDFWQPKQTAAKEFLKYNGDTVVVLARDGNRCLPMGAKVRIPLGVSHYGCDDLRDCALHWQVKGGALDVAGKLQLGKVKAGGFAQAGEVTVDISAARRPYKFSLNVRLCKGGKLMNSNNWDFWAFPRNSVDTSDTQFLKIGSLSNSSIPPQIETMIADTVDAKLVDFVKGGGRCLLVPLNSNVENTRLCYNSICFHRNFRTIPWNAGPGNSGTVVAHHPALRYFPHEGRCDLNFVRMIQGRPVMHYEPLRRYGLEPIIRSIDFHGTNYNNAYMIEFRVGRGSVLATTLGVLPGNNDHIEVAYMRKCLVDYVRSNRFRPRTRIPAHVFRRVFAKRTGRTELPSAVDDDNPGV